MKDDRKIDTKESLQVVLVTDCGSTTTKALLFERTSHGWRQTFRGEAPTTVEEPVADVTVGVRNAALEIQEVSGRRILSEATDGSTGSPFLPLSNDGQDGIDLYLSTSSAGGGLQMLVTGVVRDITTESAQRAALGAGAIVLDALSVDDGREDYERTQRIRHLRPDIVLLTGGADGGAESHVVEAAELLRAAAPRPRFGDTLRLPVIYAGNAVCSAEVEEILKDVAQVSVVENVRPTLEDENLAPAREAIHEFFLSHVMSHSPGFGKLISWSPLPIVPTPAAVGDIVVQHAERTGEQVLCADIGGATTDVFSVFRDEEEKAVFNRTVSANLGMSYSVANVLIEAGVENIRRWLPYMLSEGEVRDRLRNKMIRPTSIPETLDDLFLEQAVCREALRLSLVHHRSLAVGLSGRQKQRTIGDLFSQSSNRAGLVDLQKLDLLIGSGGVLSHAPNRLGAALMMLDGFTPEGITELALDSIFMMPHLGALSVRDGRAAEEIFLADCLIRVCHSVAPVWHPAAKVGDTLAEVSFQGQTIAELNRGEVLHIPWSQGERGTLKVQPISKRVRVGEKNGETLQKDITTGSHGFLLDGRNRPIEILAGTDEQAERQKSTFQSLGLLPEEVQ